MKIEYHCPACGRHEVEAVVPNTSDWDIRVCEQVFDHHDVVSPLCFVDELVDVTVTQ